LRKEAAGGKTRTRLRPILMTSFAFVLGVAPAAVGTGADAKMRQSWASPVSVFFARPVKVFHSIVAARINEGPAKNGSKHVIFVSRDDEGPKTVVRRSSSRISGRGYDLSGLVTGGRIQRRAVRSPVSTCSLRADGCVTATSKKMQVMLHFRTRFGEPLPALQPQARRRDGLFT
jgi:hypothetical protein